MLADEIDPADRARTQPRVDGARVADSLAHGVADWPFGRGSTTPRPAALPDGRAWPTIHIIVEDRGEPRDLDATIASVTGQGYDEASHAIVSGKAELASACRSVVADTGAQYILMLRTGDLLAPGALTALCLEAVLSGAEAVAGPRVLLGDTGVLGLDVATLRRPHGPVAAQERDYGGDVLFAVKALARAFDEAASPDRPLADLWDRLREHGAKLARIGRPVLLQRVAGWHPPRTVGLRIASLTDLGYRGGAGIAQRRLTEAFASCGHTVTHLRLADESPPAAAEWTDRFPAIEAAIAENCDLVFAGNLHGATRSAALLGALARHVRVANVLHDLFPLTGRCAHPKDCPIIATGCDARCPSPNEYPQLAPNRIAAAYGEKRAVLSGARAPMLLANSAWTQARARELAPPDTPIARIALAFPTGVFRPGDKAALRRQHGLPERDTLVLFSAVIADAPDKGFRDLVATIRAVARPGVGFVAIGRLDDAAVFGVTNLHAPGPILDEASLAQWYAACDICLSASRLETLGQTPIEAGLCGVPTVAYRATGLTSAVIDGVTGMLVEPRAGALAEALAALIADRPRREKLGAFARIVLESRFSHAACAMSLHEVFSERDLLAPGDGRLHFTPDMLGRFAFAADRHPGATDTVAPASNEAFRALRRLKHAFLGRGMPGWMRRARYAAARLRSVATRRQLSR